MRIESQNITEYICEICGSYYPSAFEAEKCESSGQPKEEPLKVGENIRYSEENQMMTRWSYSTADGLITEVKILPNIDKTAHLYIYRVNPKWGGSRYVLPRIEGGYTSPVEWIIN